MNLGNNITLDILKSVFFFKMGIFVPRDSLQQFSYAQRKVNMNRRDRLQNSPYFCVFKYARAVKQKVWNDAENRERDWGETLKIRTRLFFLWPHHTPYGRVRLARFARVRLLGHALPISLLILRKKPTVLQSTAEMTCNGYMLKHQRNCLATPLKNLSKMDDQHLLLKNKFKNQVT